MNSRVLFRDIDDLESDKRRSSKESQEKILAFADLNGRLPSEYSLNFEERRLGKALATMIAKASSQYDAAFRDLILQKFPYKPRQNRPIMQPAKDPEFTLMASGDKRHNPDRATRKSDILEFIFKERRRPGLHKSKAEINMYVSLSQYTDPAHSSYDAKFARIIERIMPSRADKVRKKKEMILNHLKSGGEIKGLSKDLRVARYNYMRTNGNAFDPVFFYQIQMLKKSA